MARQSITKKIIHPIEAAFVWLIFGFFGLLSLDTASAIGGWLGRTIGPRLKAHRIAIANLKYVMPELTEERRNEILNGMWDNLGRVAAEYPHLPGDELLKRCVLVGREVMPTHQEPAMYVSGHFGSWEVLGPIIHREGIPLALVYRKANNPYVDKMIVKLRFSKTPYNVPKGATGSIRLLRTLKDGISLAMLVDQKMTEGIAVPFFGIPAMTAPAVAKMARNHEMPLFFVRARRLKGAHFECSVFQIPPPEKTNDKDADVLRTMTYMNEVLEGWIREHPEQWFWVHRRWPKDIIKVE